MGVSMNGSYFQRLSLDETLSRTWVVYTKGLGVLFPLALLTVGVYALVWASMLTVLMPALGLDANQLDNEGYLAAHIKSFFALLSISDLVGVLIGAVGNGAYVRAVSDIYMQREASLVTSIQVGFRHTCEMLIASFLGFVALKLGCLLMYLVTANFLGFGGFLLGLYFPGIYLMVRWFLVSPVIVVEGLGPVDAMKRSWTLVTGSWCYVFCTYLIASFFLVVLQLIWNYLLSLNVYTPVGSILGSIPSVIVGPILAIMMTIMYINVRIEKEGLNVELFDRNLGESDGGKYGESKFSALINQDDLHEKEEPVTSDVA